MTSKIKNGLTVLGFCCIAVVFSGCNFMKSPISMVKKFGIWQISEDDRWRDGFYSNPTWERVIKEYKYFDKYNSSNWSDQKLGGQWYLHYVNYSTRFIDTITDELLGAFVISYKEKIPISEVLNFFKKSVVLSEGRTYNGISVIYPTQDKARILEVIAALESGNATDISFGNGSAVLRWITNKLGDKDYGEDVIFLGTYIIADVKIKNRDGTESTYESLVIYTTPGDP
jgi:hypothetical protein